MDKHPLGEMTETTLGKIKEMIDVNTIVGTPITTPDGITLIPITKVSFGFINGGSDYPKADQNGFGGGGGCGVKLDPVGFIVINDGNVKMLSIMPPANTTVDRLVEQIPDVMDKVEQFVDKHKKDK